MLQTSTAGPYHHTALLPCFSGRYKVSEIQRHVILFHVGQMEGEKISKTRFEKPFPLTFFCDASKIRSCQLLPLLKYSQGTHFIANLFHAVRCLPPLALQAAQLLSIHHAVDYPSHQLSLVKGFAETPGWALQQGPSLQAGVAPGIMFDL